MAWVACAGIGHAHVDAVRLSLSQLFLQSDVVVLARIDAVADRDLGEEGRQELLELVSATVVVVSSAGSDGRIQRLKELGVRDYIQKPFTPERIREVVDQVMGVISDAE